MKHLFGILGNDLLPMIAEPRSQGPRNRRVPRDGRSRDVHDRPPESTFRLNMLTMTNFFSFVLNKPAQLIALLLAVALTVSWALFDSPTGVERQPIATDSRAQASNASVPKMGQVDVRLERLQQPDAELAESRRNPFSLRRIATVPRPKETAVPTPFIQASPTPTGPPPPPPIPLRFLGTLQRENGTVVAVLSDGRDPVFGTQGQIILGRFEILKIGAASIELAHANGTGRQVIRLNGQ